MAKAKAARLPAAEQRREQDTSKDDEGHGSWGSLRVAIWAAATLLRVAVGYQPHSGQDNFHGQRAAYGGDFEAQRHWMELTWHLPLAQWYWYDLEYWGLDYPPLTAYVSWICGALSRWLVGPESVALLDSRGYEDPVHKSFMRATVIVMDLLCYGTVVWTLTRQQEQHPNTVSSLWTAALALIQPAILLIDHGHFQYNTVALGLSLWAFYFMTRHDFQNCIVGSIFFCLALSFKQMTLYYAPAVFFYLLGRCFARGSILKATTSVLFLGLTVVVCFATLWWPFVYFGPADTSYADRLVHVLRRIFPLQRGLFEGKVANLWCALSVKPFRIRQRLPEELQPVCALLATVVLILPVSYFMFLAGKGWSGAKGSAIQRRQLLWGATNCALAFFLASFQVHEKSLLLALAPCSFLISYDPILIEWFSIVTAWTLWPLLQIDRLQTAYVCTLAIFGAALYLRRELLAEDDVLATAGFFDRRHRGVFRWMIPKLSYAVMIALHIAELIVPAPDHMPDLFPVLWSITGCGFCCLAWLGTCWHLYGIEKELSTIMKHKLKVA